LAAIDAARAGARAWQLAGSHGPDHDVAAVRPLVVDVDATLVTAHSEKEQAAPTFKRGFGFHPLWAFADHGAEGTGEPLSVLLRKGNAGSNTAIAVVRAALKQLPRHRPGRRPGRQVLVRADGGGCIHAFIEWLGGQRLRHRTAPPEPVSPADNSATTDAPRVRPASMLASTPVALNRRGDGNVGHLLCECSWRWRSRIDEGSQNTLALAIARSIRAERSRVGLTQEELGERVNLHRVTVGAIETMTRHVYAHELAHICDALDVTPRRTARQGAPGGPPQARLRPLRQPARDEALDRPAPPRVAEIRRGPRVTR